MKHVKFSKEALLSLDAILCEMGITLHDDSNTNDEIDGTIIGYDGKAISIEEALSLFDITEEEKEANPEHETTGGYLKTVDFKTACKMMWDKLNDEEKQAVREIPNFDPEVFEEITGIDATE